MPFAAVLTRASCCFYLRVSRFSARKGISGSGLCPLTILRHIANLQAPYALRQGIPSRSSNGQQARCLCFLLALRTEDSLTRLGQRLRLLRRLLPKKIRRTPLPRKPLREKSVFRRKSN